MTERRSFGPAVSALLGALALAACGGEKTAGSGAAASGGAREASDARNACELLAARDLEVRYEKTFDAPITHETGGGEGEGRLTSCSYASTSTDGSDPAQEMAQALFVTLQVWTWPGAERAGAYLESLKEGTGDASESVAGLGDEAFRFGSGALDGVHVRKGDIAFSLSVSQRTMSADEDLAAEIDLAALVLSRI